MWNKSKRIKDLENSLDNLAEFMNFKKSGKNQSGATMWGIGGNDKLTTLIKKLSALESYLNIKYTSTPASEGYVKKVEKIGEVTEGNYMWKDGKGNMKFGRLNKPDKKKK